mmetsp:Transcript_17932/g.42378  ORF Transcript_17932/g.42378 Transcript_17932/m.42378 type:complete len:217 (+) Transcript_17932:356-1006(+)
MTLLKKGEPWSYVRGARREATTAAATPSPPLAGGRPPDRSDMRSSGDNASATPVCIRLMNTPLSVLEASCVRALLIMALRLAILAFSLACDALRSISSTLTSQASASRGWPIATQYELKSSRHSFWMWNLISARSICDWMDKMNSSSSLAKALASLGSTMQPDARWNAFWLRLAFFIFLVRRDCLLLSMLPRNSFSLVFSSTGSSPVPNLSISMSQ